MFDEFGNFYADGGSAYVFDAPFDMPGGFTDGSEIPVYTDLPNLPPSSPSDFNSSSGWDLTGIVSDIQNVFKAALQINAAYKAAQQPPVRASTPETTANANGTLTTRTASGSSVTTRMTPGTPYMTVSGVMVVNNGDGTYTVTNADGSQTRRTYPAVTSQSGFGSIPPALLWGGLAMGALFFMTRR